MGSHPINLAVRFLLELLALLVMGAWGWRQTDNWLKYVMALGIPLILAIVWGTFAVPDDPSRSGSAPVTIPGILRLLIELAIFGLVVWALYDMGYINFSWVLTIIVALHYITSYDRTRWLVAQ